MSRSTLSFVSPDLQTTVNCKSFYSFSESPVCRVYHKNYLRWIQACCTPLNCSALKRSVLIPTSLVLEYIHYKFTVINLQGSHFYVFLSLHCNASRCVSHQKEGRRCENTVLSTYVNIVVTVATITVAILAGPSGGYSQQQGAIVGIFCFALTTSLVCLVTISFNRHIFFFVILSLVFLGSSVGATVWKLTEGHGCLGY